MDNQLLSVRELQSEDIPFIVDYWSANDSEYYLSMGVDLQKLPQQDQLSKMLLLQLATPLENKSSYCLIWQHDGRAIGHCNLNPVSFGEEAYMHLHMWQNATRNKGMGTTLLALSLPFFFNHFKLQKLFCQPYALNDAPNKTLQKAGFNFDKEYVTIPGASNFEQLVKRWVFTKEMYDTHYM